jgi:predicted AAA+ superfamily ATPase
MIRRYVEQALETLAFSSGKMAFVSGPRQSGKTTLAKMLLNERGCGAYYNWDETEFRRRWTKSPRSVVTGETAGNSDRKAPLIVLVMSAARALRHFV